MSAYDAAQKSQRAAADPGQSVFVTANAGSGKTKVLVDRIVRLLLAGGAPSAFLCITFTKAAAGEMQTRLFQRLGAWCVMDDEKLSDALVDLGEPAPDAARLAQARALFARALETPGGLKIQTIHAFCERLLARFPIEAGVMPGFDIADDARGAALVAEAWRRALRDGDDLLREALAILSGRFDPAKLEEFLSMLPSQRKDFAAFWQAHQGRDSAVQAIKRRHGATLSREDHLAAVMSGARWDALAGAAAALDAGSVTDRDAAARLRLALERRDFETYRAAFMDGMRAPTKPTRNAAPDVGALFDAERARLEAGLEALYAIERAEESAAALVLAHALDIGYRAAKAERGALDFDDLIHFAHALVSFADAAPWVLYKLDGGVDHILVDEGQDTSPSQWALLEPLQAEFFAGAGARGLTRTMFAVGDEKQSIYGFQGADPDHFLRQSQLLSERAHAAGARYAGPALEMSFRSAPQVLAAVDATFAGAPLARAEPSQSAVVRHFAKRENEVGCVEWWPLALRPAAPDASPWDAPLDSERETTSAAVLARTLATCVRDWIEHGAAVWEKGKLRAMRAGDVLVLVRQRGPLFRQLLKAFKRTKLPVAGADRLILSEDIAVMDLLAAARVALDPSDDLSLAALLKSPLIGLTSDDDDIFPLAYGRAHGERLYDRLMRTDDPRYAEAKALVADIVARTGAHPYAFLAHLLETLDARGASGWMRFFARLGEEARDPLEELTTRALDIDGPATLQHFVHAIEADKSEVKRELEQADAVRIMTVHGAKGLESPVVLLPDCAAGPKSDASRGEILWTADGPVLCGKKDFDDAVAGAARAEAEEAAYGEHLRLLYVAMTRARDRLIVCAPFRGNDNGQGVDRRAWHPLVEQGMRQAGAVACETPFGEGLRLGEPLRVERAGASATDDLVAPEWAKRAASMSTPPRRRAPSLADGALLSPRKEGRARFRRGKLIHGLLQRLPDVAASERRAAGLRWLEREGAGDDAATLVDEALGVIDHPSFAAAFGPGSRAEAPLVARLADGSEIRGQVDRLVVGKGAALVIDYKTDRPPPAKPENVAPRILAQMAEYRAALRLIFPGVEVKTAIVWTEGPRLMPLPDALLDGA